MPHRITSNFTLDVFQRRKFQAKELSPFIDIYMKNITPENRTEVNELVYFLNSQSDNRDIYYFGLNNKNRPCGFATFIYYKNEKIGIVDHMAIDGNQRGYGAFFYFVELMESFLISKNIILDYVVVEIMKRSQSLKGDVNPYDLVRLLRLVGFRVIKIPYTAPHEGIMKGVDRYQSTLMVVPTHSVADLPAEECERIIKLIYYSHYYGWYKKTWSRKDITKYKQKIDSSYEIILKNISGHGFVKLNGGRNSSDFVVGEKYVSARFGEMMRLLWIFIPVLISTIVAMSQEFELSLVVITSSVTLIAIIMLIPNLRKLFTSFFWR